MGIEADLKRIESKLDFLIESSSFGEIANLRMMTVSEVAKYLGISKSSLYTTKRYMLPNFGESKEGQELKYTLKEVTEWLSQDMNELRERYREMHFN